LHNFVRNELPYLDSRTQNGKITITYSKSFKKVKKNGLFIHFKLFKQNIDTMGAIFRLSKILGITQKMFGTAGLKDKRGITTQKVSIYNAQI
jgi:tRNA pseudouridine13 synthase